LLLPAFLWLAVFVLVPLSILLVFSFQGRDELGRLAFQFTGQNYARFFFGPYLNCLGRSLGLAAITTLSTLFCGYAFCLWLVYCVNKRRRALMLLLVVLPLWTSSLLRIYAWIIILRPTGLLAHLVGAFPSMSLPPLLYTPVAVWLGMLYNYLPYMILPLYVSLEKVESDLVEAAYDLGVSHLELLYRILVPLTRGGIVAGATMVFIPSLGDYVIPDLLGGAKTMYVGNLIQNQFLVVRDWAFGCAVSTLLILIVSFAVVFYLKYSDLNGSQRPGLV
jgi:spermidine/putrescine transport system permease protein